MDVTFLQKLRADYPNFRIKESSKFVFHPPKTVCYCLDNEPHAELSLLHELSHALLGHRNFKTDIERLKMESAAWERAKILATDYDIAIDEDYIQDQLDTYRDWLHTKSRCKKCGLTRCQTPDGKYHCPHCDL